MDLANRFPPTQSQHTPSTQLQAPVEEELLLQEPYQASPLHGQGLQAQPAAGVTSLFGAPPEQPQQANVASLFRDTSEQPQQPQQTNGVGFFGGRPQQQPRQPTVSRQMQLLNRASPAADAQEADSLGEDVTEAVAAAAAE